MNNISFFKDCFSASPVKDISIFDFYDSIVKGDYATEINNIRSNQGDISKLKKELPGLTISGTFSHREIKGLLQHSGRICIDIDGKSNPQITDWPLLRTTLGTWESVEFAALSSSGKGVFVVIVVRYPEKHLLHFQALEKTFAKYGLVIDPLCKDVCRLRFMSYDSEAVLNYDVVPYRILYQEPEKKRRSKINPEDDLRKTIDVIVNMNIDITNSYKNWYEIGCALVNEFGERGRNDFHRLSKIYPEYKERECDRQYDKCLKNSKRYSRATIFYYLKQTGVFDKVCGST